LGKIPPGPVTVSRYWTIPLNSLRIGWAKKPRCIASGGRIQVPATPCSASRTSFPFRKILLAAATIKEKDEHASAAEMIRTRRFVGAAASERAPEAAADRLAAAAPAADPEAPAKPG
jgi:hypothetical protein